MVVLDGSHGLGLAACLIFIFVNKNMVASKNDFCIFLETLTLSYILSIFSCDSSSIGSNVGWSVGRSVGP